MSRVHTIVAGPAWGRETLRTVLYAKFWSINLPINAFVLQMI